MIFFLLCMIAGVSSALFASSVSAEAPSFLGLASVFAGVASFVAGARIALIKPNHTDFERVVMASFFLLSIALVSAGLTAFLPSEGNALAIVIGIFTAFVGGRLGNNYRKKAA